MRCELHTKKTWSQLSRSLHVLRPSHCPNCRNEQHDKPHADVYTEPFGQISQQGLLYKHPKGRHRCFVLNNSFGGCEVPTRQGQSVQKTPFMYVHPTPSGLLESGISAWCVAKIWKIWKWKKEYSFFLNKRLR